MSSVFETLNAISVNDHTEKKKGGSKKNEQTGKWEDVYLTYLSWPFAWAEVKKRFPEASYKIWKDENNLPYVYDERTGYMIYTSVTIEGTTHEMWLAVMDGANKAMKSEPYTYSTQKGEKTVEAATMTDINKTIMRCLVKNLAMFGLGLYIYAGEDLPETEQTKPEERKVSSKPEVNEAALRSKVMRYANAHYNSEQIFAIAKKYGKISINQLTETDCQDFINKLEAAGHNIEE